MPQAERMKIRGLKAERADIIPAGALVLWRLIKRADASAMIVSKSGLREGLLYQELLTGGIASLVMTPQNGFSFLPSLEDKQVELANYSRSTDH